MIETSNNTTTEQQYYRDLPGNEITQLKTGVQYEIPLNNPLQPGEDYNITAIIDTTPSTILYEEANNVNQGSDLDKHGQQLSVIDLRHAPVHPDGYILFRGNKIDSSIKFMIVDSSYDDSANRGFKGLRLGEEFTFGRPDATKAQYGQPADKRTERYKERFETTDLTSRNHFTITYSPEGQLLITDTSSYGTRVFGRDSARPVYQSDQTNPRGERFYGDRPPKNNKNLTDQEYWEYANQRARQKRQEQQAQQERPEQPEQQAQSAEQQLFERLEAERIAKQLAEKQEAELKARISVDWIQRSDEVLESIKDPVLKKVFEDVARNHSDGSMDIDYALAKTEEVVENYKVLGHRKTIVHYAKYHPDSNPVKDPNKIEEFKMIMSNIEKMKLLSN